MIPLDINSWRLEDEVAKADLYAKAEKSRSWSTFQNKFEKENKYCQNGKFLLPKQDLQLSGRHYNVIYNFQVINTKVLRMQQP